MPPLTDDVALLQGTREHDERQHGLSRRFEADNVRAKVWEIFGARRFELAGRADLVGRVAGHHLVDGGRVIEETVGRVANRAHHGELVVHLRETRQQLREIDAWNLGFDWLERAAHVVRHVLLGIPKIEVARPSLEVTENDALGLAPAGSALGSLFLGVGLKFKHGAKRKAHHARAANAQEVAAGQFTFCVAQVAAISTGDSDHNIFCGFFSFKATCFAYYNVIRGVAVPASG